MSQEDPYVYTTEKIRNHNLRLRRTLYEVFDILREANKYFKEENTRFWTPYDEQNVRVDPAHAALLDFVQHSNLESGRRISTASGIIRSALDTLDLHCDVLERLVAHTFRTDPIPRPRHTREHPYRSFGHQTFDQGPRNRATSNQRDPRIRKSAVTTNTGESTKPVLHGQQYPGTNCNLLQPRKNLQGTPQGHRIHQGAEPDLLRTIVPDGLKREEPENPN